MTTDPIRNRRDIEIIKSFFLDNGKTRDYAMFVAGINTALRISDLLTLKWKDILSSVDEKIVFKNHVQMVEKKTGKKNVFALSENVQGAFKLLLENELSKNGKSAIKLLDEYVFKSPKSPSGHISRFRAFQVMKNAAIKLGLDGNISCHSLRKTFGYHAWKKGASPALIMNVYNHSSIEITKRYLGINQDDRDELYRSLNL